VCAVAGGRLFAPPARLANINAPTWPGPLFLAACAAAESRHAWAMSGERDHDPNYERIRKKVTAADQIIEAQERKRCVEAIEAWNAQIESWHSVEPSPALGVALLAGFVWLDVKCHGCRQVKTIDIRTIDRHPLTPLANLTLWLRCANCDGRPRVSIRRIRDTPPETAMGEHERRAQQRLARNRADRGAPDKNS
jgi:hypothetical protein